VLKPLGGSNPLVSAMKKAARRVAVWVVAPAVALAVALFSFTLAVRYPNPVSAININQSVPSKQAGLMPSHLIPSATITHEWEVATAREQLPQSFDFRGIDYNTEDLLRATATNALLVIRDGVITYEEYAQGFNSSQPVNTMSIGKTMTAIAAGVLISEGKLREQDLVVDYLPQFASIEGFEQLKVQHLLDMQSCIGIEEEFPAGPAGWGHPVSQLFVTTDVEFVLNNNLKMVCEPGSEEYVHRSVNAQLLGMVVTRAAGMSLSNFFGATVWERVGASNDASWSVDREGGWEKSYCCFNATARDLALVGGIFLNQGKTAFGEMQGQPVVSQDWFNRMTTPAKVWFGGYGADKFGANMWHLSNGVLLSKGNRGQFMLINPSTKTIVVKLSDDLDNRYFEPSLRLLEMVSWGQR
jgi:CubicO group peptidase (beta-lactamase class C family)